MHIASAHALAFYDATISLIGDIEQNVNSCQSLGSYEFHELKSFILHQTKFLQN